MLIPDKTLIAFFSAKNIQTVQCFEILFLFFYLGILIILWISTIFLIVQLQFFVVAIRGKQTSAKGQSPTQELEEGPRGRPYLLVSDKLCVSASVLLFLNLSIQLEYTSEA